MDLAPLTQLDPWRWMLPPRGGMGVPAVFVGSRRLLRDLEEAAARQAANVARLPGIVGACYVMPDAHSGYGFPIGGVAAFDPDQGGVVCAGGVGYDIACGVRTLATDLDARDLDPVMERLADRLFAAIPCGVGVGGGLALKDRDLDALLTGGAAWAVKRGFGEKADLERIEDRGTAPDALPDKVSPGARARLGSQVGTLGSGNHYLEVQRIEELFDARAAAVLGLFPGQTLVSVHCGSRGLGHQVATDFIDRMRREAQRHGLSLPDPELACAPIDSQPGRDYLGAMRAAVNCALANRQVIDHLVRRVLEEFFPGARPRLVCDVSHNTCREERLDVEGRARRLFVHRKGATRAWGPSHPGLTDAFRGLGQIMPVGGSMGAASYLLRGTDLSLERSLGSACHGAGRALSRSQALKRFKGRDVMEGLARRGVTLRAKGLRAVGEEAPGAYKDIEAVVEAAEQAGLAARVARLAPLACVKG
ncbi:RNA-splicing ligase RtcB [Fundidesulfovibrio magnetotacticus]|uniref:tRNA-splicing ligase RtcB n=1 Tax=Fundidesulfovibrio magnetotacticus TaxID=2730080 RepID=A0A6V8LXF2_9BACT|nr:RtcB family protein [Fundidesulfovibrio magnetotacticus]GFK94486.1 RNA-splicing ligase RtcB [Fundidesulfovibrio magnetotacticus]